jgi:hypothetical protein
MANICPRGDNNHQLEGMFKKVRPAGRSYFDARSVHGVREHGKKARTPLAAFFNIPIWPIGEECLSGIQILEGKFFMSEGHEI